jgi:hypothetical protein
MIRKKCASGGTQNESKSDRGGQPGNENALKKLRLHEPLSLETDDEVLRFIRSILIPETLRGNLGTRSCSALTTACRVLLDYGEGLKELERRISELERRQLR